MQLDKAIKTRKSVRKFKSKKPSWRTIIECIDATRYAPMAGENFTLKFILVKDPEKIRKLADASQQDFIAEAHYVLVVCSKISRTVNAYGLRGKRYCRQQAGAAIQNFLLRIQEEGLSTCWIGHFVDDIVRDVLQIPDEINVEALLPIGYEFKEKSTRHSKIDLDAVLYFDEYKNKKMKKPKKIDI